MTAEPDGQKLIKSQRNEPCGCIVIEYSDESKLRNPCVPCGLVLVANALGEAANALGTVAMKMRQAQQQAVLAATIQSAAKK